MKKKVASQNIQTNGAVQETLEIPTIDATCKDEDNSVSLLEELKEIEQQLLVEKRQIIGTLVKWQTMFDGVTDNKRRLMSVVEEKRLSKRESGIKAEEQDGDGSAQPSSEGESRCMLFSVVSWGPSWDGLVFTVMAENDAWAEELVREWLDSNGRENHKIDKVMALVSQNARGIVNVGAKLLDA